MDEKENFEISAMPLKVWKAGGSLVVTVDHKFAEYEGIKEGDIVKVKITKLPKKEEKEEEE